MSLEFWYWLILVLYFLFGGYYSWSINGRVFGGPFFTGWFGNSLLIFLLLIIIGLQIFHEGPLGALIKK